VLKHGSLFSGIGGFDLAAEWMGWENVFHCEWNEFGKRVLNYYWPNAISYDDITKTDFTIHRGTIDILTGGFPCQPYSVAGKRKGKEDERHLWPEMLRAIREIQPRYVVGENVAGLISWDGGLVFHEVQTDLENEGYEVWPFILPACAVNAPHRRDRVWFVAYSDKCTTRPSRTSDGITGQRSNNNDEPKKRRQQTEQRFGCSNVLRNVTNSESQRSERMQPCEQCEVSQQEQEQFRGGNCQNTTTNTGLLGQEKRKQQTARVIECGGWEEFPTQPPICSGNDGIPKQLDGITFSKWRTESVKAYGNAIVPQVALQIFKAIQIIETDSK
jgi:DNA (cytosine-5)-methyltransferase 1